MQFNLKFKKYCDFLIVRTILIKCLHCVYACLQMVWLCYHKALIYKELRFVCLFLSFVFYEKAAYLCKQKRETDRYGKKSKHIAHTDDRKLHSACGIYGGFPSAWGYGHVYGSFSFHIGGNLCLLKDLVNSLFANYQEVRLYVKMLFYGISSCKYCNNRP